MPATVIPPSDSPSPATNPLPGDDGGGVPEAAAPEASSPEVSVAEAAAPDAGTADEGGGTTPDAEPTGGQGTNLVTDGDFSQPSSPLWAVVAGAGTVTVTNGELCVSVAAGGQATLGWPQPAGSPGAVVAPGTSYTFSYKARATQPLSVDAKVGQSNPPYAADFESANEPVTTSVQTLTHTFTTSQGDSSTGIAFAFMAGSSANQVCFQAVALVAN